MGGSKKGERRGNARKKPQGAIFETPGEIMREAVRRPRNSGQSGKRGESIKTIDQRIEISRVMLGESSAVTDMTPKEIMLHAMHQNFQAAVDWRGLLMHYAALPPTPENTAVVTRAEAEIERLLDKSAERARDVAPYLHPKLSAIQVAASVGDNQGNIVQDLLDEIDRRQREQPMTIEHIPRKKTA